MTGSRIFTSHITTDNGTAYGPNDLVGPLQSISGAAFNEGGDISLKRITIHDRDKEAKPLYIHLFSEGLSSATSTVNNQQFAINYADLKKELACIPVAASDFKTHLNGATAAIAVDIPIVVRSSQGQLCMAVVSKEVNNPLSYSSVQSLAIDLLFK